MILREPVVGGVAVLHELVEAAVVEQPPLEHPVQEVDGVYVVRAHLPLHAPLLLTHQFEWK